MTTLIACSHGTRFPEGQAVITALVDEVRRVLPGIRVLPAFVDVEEPSIDDVVAGLDAEETAVVVPLLLSRGFHTGVDIARAAESRPGVVAAAALGPHELLAQVLVSRLAEVGAVPEGEGAGLVPGGAGLLPGGADGGLLPGGAGLLPGGAGLLPGGADADLLPGAGSAPEGTAGGGLLPGDHVVLAAAGSSAAVAVEDVERVRALLQPFIDAPITIGYAAGATPRIADAVAAARAAGAQRVVVASYVLAPGFFANLVARAGGDVVTAPLGADPRIAELIALRYREALPA